jgi:tetratricopeptide (TPR) repeat protein
MPLRLHGFFSRSALLLALLVALVIGCGIEPLMESVLPNLANVAATKVLLSRDDRYLPEAIWWYIRSQQGVIDVRRVTPLVLASLYVTSCDGGIGSILKNAAVVQQVRIALQARCWWLDGEQDLAIHAYQQAGLAPYLYHLAAHEQEQGNFEGSRDGYEVLLAVDPVSVEGWLGLGSLCEETGDWACTEQAYEEAIRLAPNNPLVHQAMASYRWGRALGGDRTEYELIRAIELAVALPPDASQSLPSSGDVVWMYERAHMGRPDLPDLYTRLAGVYVWTGRPSLSEEAARKAIALAPSFPWAYHFLGDALRLQGKNPEAIIFYKKALAIGETSVWLHYGLARAYIGTGELSDAVQETQYLLMVNPLEPAFLSLDDELQKLGTTP